MLNYELLKGYDNMAKRGETAPRHEREGCSQGGGQAAQPFEKV